MAWSSCNCSLSGACFEVEKWFLGYKPEHIYLGLQVAVAFIAATSNLLYDAIKNESAVWIVVTVAVVMEPNMGGTLRKGLLRALGALLGGALAMATIALAALVASHNDVDYSQSVNPGVGAIIISGVALCGFLLTVHRQRLQHIEHFFFVALYTMPVTLSAAMLDEDSSKAAYADMGWRVVNVLLGIGVATLVSVLVFPIRARWVLQRDMASMLIRLGDLTVWILNQVCVHPNPDYSFPGTSYTDKSLTYCDDGVEARLAPLMEATRRQGGRLVELSVLLGAADKEWYFFRQPRVFPTAKYKLLLDSCQNILAMEASLLYWLQSSVTNLALVHASACDLRELGVRASAACTALSHLVLPPRLSKSSKALLAAKKWSMPARDDAKGGESGSSDEGSSRDGSGGGGGSSSSAIANVDKRKWGVRKAWRLLLRLQSPWRGEAEVDEELHEAAGAAAAEADCQGDEACISLGEHAQQAGEGQEAEQWEQHQQAAPAAAQDDLEAPAVAAAASSAGRSRAGSRDGAGDEPVASSSRGHAAEENPFAQLVAAQLASQQREEWQSGSNGPEQQQAGEQRPAAASNSPATPSSSPATPSRRVYLAGVSWALLNPPPPPQGPLEAASAAGDAAAAASSGLGGPREEGNGVGSKRQGGRQQGSKRQRWETGLGAAALAKLCAMVDATQGLMQALATARASGMGTGLPTPTAAAALLHQWKTGGPLQHAATFDTMAMTVNTGVGIARQLAAMFTALAPGGAVLLHDHVIKVVRELGEMQQQLGAEPPGVEQLGAAAGR